MEVSKEQFVHELGSINNSLMGLIQGVKGIMTNNERLISMVNLESELDGVRSDFDKLHNDTEKLELKTRNEELVNQLEENNEITNSIVELNK